MRKLLKLEHVSQKAGRRNTNRTLLQRGNVGLGVCKYEAGLRLVWKPGPSPKELRISGPVYETSPSGVLTAITGFYITAVRIKKFATRLGFHFFFVLYRSLSLFPSRKSRAGEGTKRERAHQSTNRYAIKNREFLWGSFSVPSAKLSRGSCASLFSDPAISSLSGFRPCKSGDPRTTNLRAI